MEYSSGSDLASDFKSAKRQVEITTTITFVIVRHEVLLPINWVNNKKRETLKLKILYKGRYHSYQCIISLSSIFLSVKILCKMSND